MSHLDGIAALRQWLADNHHLAGRDPQGKDADAQYTAHMEQCAALERKAGLRLHIAREGQSHVDKPQYSTTQALPLAYGIAAAFGRTIPEAVRVFNGYEKTKLRWMKPGPDGKLIPRDEKCQ